MAGALLVGLSVEKVQTLDIAGEEISNCLRIDNLAEKYKIPIYHLSGIQRTHPTAQQPLEIVSG